MNAKTYTATETITCPVYGGIIISDGDILTASDAIDAAGTLRRSRAVDSGDLTIGPGFMFGSIPRKPQLRSAVRELRLVVRA